MTPHEFKDGECPCGNKNLQYYRLMQYRPKEFIVKCDECGRQHMGRGSHFHVMVREWQKRFPIDQAAKLGHLPPERKE